MWVSKTRSLYKYSTPDAMKCVRQRLPLKSRSSKVQGSQKNKEAELHAQLLCTLSCILLTSLISISFQHIQPSPAMNQNLEGSLFFVLRKKPFDKVVMDARQSGLGWVPSFDWHYTFMMQTIGEDRAPEQGLKGAESEALEGGI